MNAERWRLFVAAPISDDLRRHLAASVNAWKQRPDLAALRWTDPTWWHVTLGFLGSIRADSVTQVLRAVEEVAGAHRTTRVKTGRLGAFHRPGSVRTLWYGVSDTDGAVSALAGDLARALGLAADEPFRPHITLARARQRPVDLRGWIEQASLGSPAGQLEVKTVHLLRSHLGNGPARYKTLESFPLGGAP